MSQVAVNGSNGDWCELGGEHKLADLCHVEVDGCIDDWCERVQEIVGVDK